MVNTTLPLTDLVIQGPAFDASTVSTIMGLTNASTMQRSEACIRFPGIKPSVEVRSIIKNLCVQRGLDFAFVSPQMRLRDFSALFFDMDSTLTRNETLDDMAALFGLGEAVSEITARVMRGEIKDYASSLRQRVAHLKGLSADSLTSVADKIVITPGAEKLIGAAQSLGLKTYVCTSGFTQIAQSVADRLGMTGICANTIEITDGVFTGSVCGPQFNKGKIIDADGKAHFVQTTMQAMGKTNMDAICFGDGSNDIKMCQNAGFSVGVRPKPVLRDIARASIDVMWLDSVLNLFSDTARR